MHLCHTCGVQHNSYVFLVLLFFNNNNFNQNFKIVIFLNNNIERVIHFLQF